MTKNILNNNISDNGDMLRRVADWFEENVDSAKQKLKSTKINRAIQIAKTKQESSWEAIKYYLQQLYNVNKVGVNGILEYFTRMANIGLIDNAVLRKMEKAYAEMKRNDKKFFQWLKKHPSVSSYFSYWLLIAALSVSTWGGVKISKYAKDKKGDTKEILAESQKDKDENDNRETKSKVYDITDANFVNNFVEENWEDIVICLLEFETYRSTPVLQESESRYTYGPGLTWVYTNDDKKGIVQHPCTGSYVTKAKNFSDKEVWEQVKNHTKKESLRIVKNALQNNKITQASKEQILGLFIAAYQRPADVSGIVKGIATAENDEQKQIDAFQYYDTKKGGSSYKDGTLKRRWWCAMYYIGKINSQDLLKLNRDVFSSPDVNTFLQKKHFKQDEATIAYALTITNKRSTVEDFIKQHNLFAVSDKPEEPKKTITFEDATKNPSMTEMIAGLKAFQSGKYETAVQYYQKAVELDADNMEAYSSISISYKKLGDKYLKSGDIAKAEDCYNKSIEFVKKGNARMNANKDLLLDREIKAYLYYNAGQARDDLAGIHANKNDLASAVRDCDLAAKNYQTAIDNAKEVGMDDSMIEIYTAAKTQSLSNKADLSKKQKSQQAIQKKKATIKSATSKVKSKRKKQQAFATATTRLKQGKTFDARGLFVKTKGEHTA